ncbi:hypothetical protein POM88_013325 [Heracleum sosnowskyi]|uniref:Uncharacterized protein n=1 Tax=Heracleum sosnowskyi TaxID=360622 RepID=A0AAD8IY61_9APIA|nr:hypothetical protein POM88_013325 [Heracleum sosnowskyi]
MFLPLVFVVLICSVLVSALAGVVYRVFFRADRKGLKNVKGYRKNDEKTPIVKDDDMGKNCSVLDQGQTTRRRNANEKDRKDYMDSSIEGKNVARFDGDLGNKNAVAEENWKELREVKANIANEKAGPCLLNASQTAASPAFISSCIEEPAQFSGVKAETEGESLEDLEEEDAHEDTNKVQEGQTNDFNTIQGGNASEVVFNSFHNYHEKDGCELKKKQNLHENIDDGSTSSSSSEDDVPLCTADKVELLRSLSSLARKDITVPGDDNNDQENDVLYSTDRLLYEKTKDNSYFGEKKLCHGPSNSLASDLQVEVSEVSSPQSTSSNENCSLFDYYINKEATSGCEDTCAGLSRLSGEAINELNSREINKTGEEVTTDVGSSRINHNLDPNTSYLQPEKVAQQDEISSLSQPLNLPESIQSQANDFNPESRAASIPTDAPPTYDSEDSTERVVAHTSDSKNLQTDNTRWHTQEAFRPKSWLQYLIKMHEEYCENLNTSRDNKHR